MRAERQIQINAPADKVFEYVSDIERHPEWATRPLQAKKTSEGPVGVGSTYQTTGKQFGTHTDTVRVTDYTPPSKFGFESTGDAGVVRHWFTVAETGGATTLTKIFEIAKPAFTTKLFMPVVKRGAPKDLDANLQRIKQRIEGSA